MFKKIVYVLWVLANLYVIYSGGKSCYIYYTAGNTLYAVLTGLAVVGFTLLTAFIIYRDIKDYSNKKKHIPTYPNYCGLCTYQNDCPNKHAGIKLLCGVDECKYWKADKEEK